MWNCHLNCAVKLPKGNITISWHTKKDSPQGSSALVLPCPPLSLPTCQCHPCRKQCNTPYLTWQLLQPEIQDTPVHRQPRTVHLWKSFFLASSKCRCFLTQAQELCSLRCCILARRAHIVYELCIKSVPCPRLLWDLHLLGTWSLLFLLFWNTGE